MSNIILEGADYDRLLSISDLTTRNAAIASNDAFILAMAKAVKRGREKVTVGTFVDMTSPTGAKRLYGILPMSACGSPAAMCMEAGGSHIGAEAMK